MVLFYCLSFEKSYMCKFCLLIYLYITVLRCLNKSNLSQQKHGFIGTFWICSSYVLTSIDSYVF